MTIAVIDGTEKFGSSSWPSRVKPNTPAMTMTRIRNKTMARWFSAHSVRLNDFIARPVSRWVRGAGEERDLSSGAIFCTPAVTTSSPAGAGHQHVVVAIAVHGDGEQADRSDRLVRLATHDPHGRLALVLGDRGGRDGAAAFWPAGRSTTSVAVAPSGSGRGVAGFSRARNVRVCAAACGESSRSTTSNIWSGALASDAL